jgi:pSer/pThr/pTyr-binding forkhead associated (FHA) protein
MALTIVVLSGAPGVPGGGPSESPSLSLTLDAPRVVIGRGDGCEVRLPDPTVSHRHASIRQRGGEHVLLDENSTNGTFMDRVKLPPHTPRVLRSGERVRLGRVWLEVRFEPAIVKGSTAAAAKELALALVTRGLRAQGEAPDPTVTVLDGPNRGAVLVLGDVGRTYALGKSNAGDLQLDEPEAGRRHATLMRKADALVVTDCGTPLGTYLDEQRIQEAVWKPGQSLAVGGTLLGFTHPAAEALAELERCPDERMAEGEVPEPAAAPPPAAAVDETPAVAPTPPAAVEPAPRKQLAKETSGWNALDSAVVLLALGVLVASVIGAIWLLGR